MDRIEGGVNDANRVRSKRIMLIGGELSGDMVGAELVRALRNHWTHGGRRPDDAQLEFFGAGGPHMGSAGVELAFDLTRHSVIGLWEVIRHYGTFRRLFDQLLSLALERKPDVIIGIDYGGFNLRFAKAIRKRAREVGGKWNPKLVQLVSPQVWASRPGHAKVLAGNHDLLLSIFPFEKEWYRKRVPGLRVEFVGHPILDRHKEFDRARHSGCEPSVPNVLLLPGSRLGELRRHLPVVIEAARQIRTARPEVQFRMVLPDKRVRDELPGIIQVPTFIEVQAGELARALEAATIAIASTGTVTLECACFGVPAVALYKTSWSTFQIGRRLITVPYLAMPNILAGEPVYPEFIQNHATPENVAQAAVMLLNNPKQRAVVRARLAEIISGLGSAGASERAAVHVIKLLEREHPHE